MSDYKLVPVEPTAEMIEAAQDAHMPFGDMDIALRMALLAAPAVQGEPVAYASFAENGNIQIWCSDPIQAETLRHQYGDRIKPLYAAPQPGIPKTLTQEQQPDVARLVEALEMARDRIESERPSGEWDPLLRDIDDVLAAYRKGAKK